MAGNVVSFDIETTVEAGANLREMPISCAARCTDGSETVAVHGPLNEAQDRYAEALTREEASRLVDRLLAYVEEGSTVVTWNGAAFDFPILGYQSDRLEDCRTLALGSVDVAFLMLCAKGFMAGLEAVAKGMGLGGKAEPEGGVMAPILWKRDLKSQQRVLRYVARDALLTCQIYMAILAEGFLRWVTASGKRTVWEPPQASGRLLTVKEALELPLPDTSWMKNPRTRASAVAWMRTGAEVDTAVGVTGIDLDMTSLEGSVLHLDLEHSAAAQAAAATFSHMIRDSDPELARRVQLLIASAAR